MIVAVAPLCLITIPEEAVHFRCTSGREVAKHGQVAKHGHAHIKIDKEKLEFKRLFIIIDCYHVFACSLLVWASSTHITHSDSLCASSTRRGHPRSGGDGALEPRWCSAPTASVGSCSTGIATGNRRAQSGGNDTQCMKVLVFKKNGSYNM